MEAAKANYEFEQSLVDSKNAKAEMDRIIYKIIVIGEEQQKTNPVVKLYVDKLKTAYRELNAANDEYIKDPSNVDNYKQLMLKMGIVQNLIKLLKS